MSRTPEFDEDEEEEYIVMEIATTREFEFQMSRTSPEMQNSCGRSPADELFCEGNLLPLLLIPRLQMLHTILHSSSRLPPPPDDKLDSFELMSSMQKQDFSIQSHPNHFLASSYSPPTTTTQKLTWCNTKLQMVTRASSAFFKTLVSKTGFFQVEKKKKKKKKKKMEEAEDGFGFGGLKSFFGVVKWVPPLSTSSSCSSSSRTSSAAAIGSDEEISIESAIDHCKRSRVEQKSLGGLKMKKKEERVEICRG